MTAFFRPLAVLLLGLGVGCPAQAAEPTTARHTLPGTGVSLALPAGMSPAPVGPYLTDATGETSVFVMMGPASTKQEQDPVNRSLFPHRIEALDGLGTLYRRTRAEHGGAWDGWRLYVERGDTMLIVQAAYTGDSPEAFERLAAVLRAVEWDDDVPRDTELAMGLRTSTPGFRISHAGNIGALGYVAGGSPGMETEMTVMPYPLGVGQDAAGMIAACPGVIGNALSAPRQGPHAFDTGDVAGCDAWSGSGDAAGMYFALVRLGNGALVLVNGSGDPARIRAGILGLQPTR